MVYHQKDIESPVNVFFFGDTQHGSKGFDKEAWEQFKDSFKSTPNSYAIGLGDYDDFLRPTMRARVQASMAGDDSARQEFDDKIRHSQDKIIEMLSFMEGRIIGLHSGHHEWEFASGENSTQRLCIALKCPYLGWMASTRLRVLVHPKHGHAYIYTIISMHGTGNARTTTTDGRWLEVNIVPAWIADHYVRGHSCKSIAWSPFERHFIRRRDALGAEHQTVRCLNVGGFHKGYTDGWENSYVERAGFLPQPVSWGLIRLNVKECGAKEMRRRGLTSRKSYVIHVENLSQGSGASASFYDDKRDF